MAKNKTTESFAAKVTEEKEARIVEVPMVELAEPVAKPATVAAPKEKVVLETQEVAFATDGYTHVDNFSRAETWCRENGFDKYEPILNTTCQTVFLMTKYVK